MAFLEASPRWVTFSLVLAELERMASPCDGRRRTISASIEGGKSPAKVSAGGKFAVKTSTVFCRLLDAPGGEETGPHRHPAARNDAAQGTLRPYWPPPSRTRHEWFSFLSAWE